METDRFRRALTRLDALHAEDPATEEVRGELVPAELAYARRMTGWLMRLNADASEALRLAVRAQHLCRWRLPRSDYPMDRPGYKAWRREQLRQHATLATTVLTQAGYDRATVERVDFLIRKRKLKVDAESQTLEDAACLVFLESYFADFARLHDESTLVRILRKTWPKMSERAHALALELPLARRERALVERALAG